MPRRSSPTPSPAHAQSHLLSEKTPNQGTMKTTAAMVFVVTEHSVLCWNVFLFWAVVALQIMYVESGAAFSSSCADGLGTVTTETPPTV